MPKLTTSRFFSSILAASVFLFSACEQQPTVVETRESILAFGTFVEVTLINIGEEDRKLVLEKIEQDLNYFNFALHAWKPGPTGRTNQLLEAAGEFTANPSLLPIITKSKQLSAQSQGLFNPAIGHLLKIWGYHNDLPPEGPPPEDEDIKIWLEQKPSMETLTMRGVRINNTNPAVKLDFGAVGKGYALDVTLQHLKDMGVNHAIINTGGDLKVLGQHGERPWKVGIRHPRSEGVIASVALNDGEAIVTSGDYERFYEFDSKRYHHIIDPRTGYPADQAQSVTVIHRDGATADAASTALFVAGPQQWLQIAKAMGVEQAMLIDKDGKVLLTRSMQARIKFENAAQKHEVFDLP